MSAKKSQKNVEKCKKRRAVQKYLKKCNKIAEIYREVCPAKLQKII